MQKLCFKLWLEDEQSKFEFLRVNTKLQSVAQSCRYLDSISHGARFPKRETL